MAAPDTGIILAVVQARMGSSRLPGKVLLPLLEDRSSLELMLERITRARLIDTVIIATGASPANDPIAALSDRLGYTCFRGDEDDVLDRFYQAAVRHGACHLVRLTGDCPLIDPELIDNVIDFYRSGGFDYVSNTIEPTFPDGLDVEVFSFSALEQAWQEATLYSQREHVTPFLYTQPERFTIGSFTGPQDNSAMRWTLDEPEDLAFIRQIYDELYSANPCFSTEDVFALLLQKPDLGTINSRIKRNEGYGRSLQEDKEIAEK